MWDEELPSAAAVVDDGHITDEDEGLGAGASLPGSDSDEGEPEQRADGSSGEDGQQQQPQRIPRDDKAVLRAERNREARKRRRGAKLSALEYEASRQLLATLAERPAAEQADYLWTQYQAATLAAPLERQDLGLDCNCLAGPLPEGPGLEARLRVLAGDAWQPAFCSCAHGTPPGTPAVLCVSASALGALAFVKGLPEANNACRIGARRLVDKANARRMSLPSARAEALRASHRCSGLADASCPYFLLIRQAIRQAHQAKGARGGSEQGEFCSLAWVRRGVSRPPAVVHVQQFLCKDHSECFSLLHKILTFAASYGNCGWHAQPPAPAVGQRRAQAGTAALCHHRHHIGCQAAVRGKERRRVHAVPPALFAAG